MADTARLLVLYHSSYGHTETLAYAVAHGARAVEGVHVSLKRVPELVPEEIMHSAGMKIDQPAPIADPQELAEYDGIIFGTPTRFGNMTSQMRNFLDQTGPLWVGGALIGKVGSVFTSTSTGGDRGGLVDLHAGGGHDLLGHQFGHTLDADMHALDRARTVRHGIGQGLGVTVG